MWSIQVQWRPHSGLDRKRDQSRKSPLAECYRVNKDSSDQQGGAGFSLHRKQQRQGGATPHATLQNERDTAVAEGPARGVGEEGGRGGWVPPHSMRDRTLSNGIFKT